MSWCVSLCTYPVWDSLHLLNLIDHFLFHVGEIFNYNLLKKFLISLLLLFFFWDPYHSNVGAFDIVPEVSETVLSSFHSFYFILLFRSYSEKAMAPHSSTLAWKIPWTEKPGRLQSMGSLRVGHD